MRVSQQHSLFLSSFGRFQKSFGFVFFFSVVVVLFSVPPPLVWAGQGTAAPSLPPQAIAESLVEWSKRIDNFSMKWNVAYFTLRGEPRPIDHERFHHQVKEFVWTKEGRFWSHERHYVNRDWFTRDVHIYDCQVDYRASYEKGFSVLSRPIRLRFGVRATVNTMHLPQKRFLPLEGVWDSLRLTWDIPTFEEEQIKSAGTEWRRGRGYCFIQFRDGARILFDPDHNCLPCCVRQTIGEEHMVYVVEDFREVEPGLWFPAAGYEEVRSAADPERNGIKRWKVVDLKINQSIPASAFSIKPVVGTEIEDTFTGFYYTYGRNMPPGTLESGLNERWLNYVKYGGPHPFPLRHRPNFWQQWRCVLLFSALILCGVVLAWRTLLPKGVL